MATNAPPPALSDSPWYWVYLFCTAGLVALVLMGPRFAGRQAQIENKAAARLSAARQVSGQRIEPLAPAESTIITLRPLYVILALLLCVAWVHLWRHHRRRRKALLDEAP
jgi:hypothetical protein